MSRFRGSKGETMSIKKMKNKFNFFKKFIKNNLVFQKLFYIFALVKQLEITDMFSKILFLFKYHFC